MHAARHALRHVVGRLLVASILATGLGTGISLTSAPSAQAAVSSSVGIKVVRAAATRKGTPYRYGGTTVRGFDCSGYTRWAYARVGKHLPRTSQAQYRATIHIRPSQRRPGDLVFFHSGRHIYHVGIYAGHGRMWASPHTGARVRLSKIWTSNVWYGRVR
jgi:cell wall-associated NlpC family hydrolase